MSDPPARVKVLDRKKGKLKMTKVLSHLVSKCQSCNWTGDSWDTICSVNKSHKTEQMFAYYEQGIGYTYSKEII
jgi:hypothetical protein